MAERRRTFLIVPAAGAGEGMGHLARCLRLARDLGPSVTFLATRMDSAARALLADELERFPARPRPGIAVKLEKGRRWDLILLDARRTSCVELEALMAVGPVVSLDEGGEARDHASFLIDALPGPRGLNGNANLSSPAFLDLPDRKRKSHSSAFRKILVSFGGEDREDLTARLLDAAFHAGVLSAERVTVVEGPLFRRHVWPQGVAVLREISRLGSVVASYDLVVTHFGMGAFEALAAGVPVVLFNPSAYHERLSAAAGFVSIGTGRPDTTRLRSILNAPEELFRHVKELNARLGKDRRESLARALKSICPVGSPACPVCQKDGNAVIARFPDRSYRACARCGTFYMESFAPHKEYDRKYFFSDYKSQYGRTYLEDFDSIETASVPRVQVLRELLGEEPDGVVVDVGCAFGPFLSALKAAGMPCYGIDVFPGAVSYVKKKLGIPALSVAFEDVDRRSLPRRIAAITMWYVIEHFTDTYVILRKAADILPAGGVFAFSTPNGRGISARRSLSRFLERSPSDHFTIFSPRRLRQLLAGYGFELRRIRVTGHHPERFPGALGRAAERNRGVFRLVHAVSRLAGLGDTFEAYAVKGER
jgi:2-polyprenyl-3-methyl-5-hydroxy-6-metoxy-1,4-benzoquinol methylase